MGKLKKQQRKKLIESLFKLSIQKKHEQLKKLNLECILLSIKERNSSFDEKYRYRNKIKQLEKSIEKLKSELYQPIWSTVNTKQAHSRIYRQN